MANKDRVRKICAGAGLSVTAASVAAAGAAYAEGAARSAQIKSRGKIVIAGPNGTVGEAEENDDVVFDSDDLVYLANEIDGVELGAEEAFEEFCSETEAVRAEVEGAKATILGTIENMNGSDLRKPDGSYPTWEELSQMIETEAAAAEERGYNEGLAENLAQSNAVNIEYHTHNGACQCGATGTTQHGNSGDWHYSGNGNWWWSVWYTCSACGANRGSRSQWINNGWGMGEKNTVTPVCTNIRCGRTPGSTIDKITVNGTTYDVYNGTITQN